MPSSGRASGEHLAGERRRLVEADAEPTEAGVDLLRARSPGRARRVGRGHSSDRTDAARYTVGVSPCSSTDRTP